MVLLVAVLAAAVGGPSSAGRGTAGRYRAPVAGAVEVVRPFQPPPGPYAAGHRGADLALSGGAAVLAAGAGTVSCAGTVVDRGVVVVVHADGISTEYEPVAPLVRPGEPVAAGQPVGTLSGPHAGCATSCLHWGARRGGVYLDPMSLLRPLGVVRLVPDG